MNDKRKCIKKFYLLLLFVGKDKLQSQIKIVALLKIESHGMVAFLKYKVTVWTPSMHHPGGPLDLLSRTQHQIARPEKN